MSDQKIVTILVRLMDGLTNNLEYIHIPIAAADAAAQRIQHLLRLQYRKKLLKKLTNRFEKSINKKYITSHGNDVFAALLYSGDKLIAYSPDRSNIFRLLGINLDFFTQVGNMYVNRSVCNK